MITLIVARAKNGAIGKDNTIPWEAPEDLAFFQRETIGGAMIMGRRTWESLPYKPLKGRLNIVVSSREMDAEHVCTSVDQALSEAFAQGYRRVYGIGGNGIFKALLPKADRLLITEVDLHIDAADAYFPDIEPADWDLAGQNVLREAVPRCELHEYLRNRSEHAPT